MHTVFLLQFTTERVLFFFEVYTWKKLFQEIRFLLINNSNLKSLNMRNLQGILHLIPAFEVDEIKREWMEKMDLT